MSNHVKRILAVVLSATLVLSLWQNCLFASAEELVTNLGTNVTATKGIDSTKAPTVTSGYVTEMNVYFDDTNSSDRDTTKNLLKSAKSFKFVSGEKTTALNSYLYDGELAYPGKLNFQNDVDPDAYYWGGGSAIDETQSPKAKMTIELNSDFAITKISHIGSMQSKFAPYDYEIYIGSSEATLFNPENKVIDYYSS